jgi:hypothetical protein
MMHGNPGKQEIIIVTKYFAPVNVVDSNSVYDLCRKLLEIDLNLKIHVVTTSINYKSNVKLRDFDALTLGKLSIYRVNHIAILTKYSFFRILADISTGFLLALKARKLSKNTIISLSNPPLINTWCALLLRKKKYIYWSFDIFPEALFASNLIGANSLLGKCIRWCTYVQAPKAIIAMGPKQFEYLNSCYAKNSIEKVILPCGIHDFLPSDQIPEWFLNDRIIVGYIGNLGKAHSKDFLLNVIKEISVNDKYLLIISIYGDSSKEVINTIHENNQLGNIKIVQFVNQSELVYIDIHLVSLLENWTNISVPSKAVSAVCSNSALWFNGSRESDTFNLFEKCSYYSNSDQESVSEVLKSITKDDISRKRFAAIKIAKKLQIIEQESINKLYSLF